MINLNPSQKEAVLYTDGPLLIFAGAGSGKTRVLTARIAHLIESGINPRNILAITFTNKAAKEMRERVEAITPLGGYVWVSTFHSACTRILRFEIELLGYEKGFSIYDTSDSERLLKDCIGELNLSDTHYNAKAILSVISSQKNELITPEEYETYAGGDYREGNIADVYTLYQKKLKAANALDFDDIIMKLVELFQTNEHVLRKWQSRFHYVMVDEYQDTNRAQYVLVNLLAGYARNLCVVGDDDQSIYGWRGADIMNILHFANDYPDAKIIKLEQNYRCTKIILEAANAVIAGNMQREEKKLWTDNNRGERIKIYPASDDRDEAAFAARIISQEVSKGAKYNDFAMLYRMNAQSRALEEQLVYAGIPYRIFSGVKFYDRMEIKDILAYLKAINNPADDMAAIRIINVPKRGIGQTSINKIQTYALTHGKSFIEAVNGAMQIEALGKKSLEIKKFGEMLDDFAEFAASNTILDLLLKIIDETGYSMMFEDGSTEGKERIENIKELIAKAQVFVEDSDDTSLGKFLEDVALVADIDGYEEDVEAVSLMTLHSAKGLEFNAVLIAGFEEHIFPTSRSIDSIDQKDMEEERRLCYVGITRAKKQLYLMRAYMRRRFDRLVNNAPSRFLHEIPAELITDVNMYGDEKSFQHSKERKLVNPLQPLVTQNLRPSIARPVPKIDPPDFEVGDKIKQPKHGIGVVVSIDPAGADYEVTVDFPEKGRRKFMSSLAKLEKV